MWETLLIRAVGGGNEQFVAVPSAAVADSSSLQQRPSFESTLGLLNQLGRDGWELVTAAIADDGHTGSWWLKRPLAGQPGDIVAYLDQG